MKSQLQLGVVMPERVIFLDFDGVLVTKASQARYKAWYNRTPEELRQSRLDRDCMKIDDDAIAALKLIIEETGAKIVVSSSWRIGRTLEHIATVLRANNFHHEIIGKTPTRDRKSIGRGGQIQKWLDKTERDIESFVILDDNSDMAHLMDRLVQCDCPSQIGLTLDDAQRAVDLLEQPL
jgi:predicted dinucleotide-utilizing enzyme